MKTSHDIIIVGGGITGLMLACALAQQTSLSVVILEAQAETASWSASKYHHRVSAIALSSQRIFKSLQVWDAIQQKRVSPFTKIQVWDGVGEGEIQFDSTEIAEPILGYIIENNAIQSALAEKLKQYPSVEYVSPIKLNAFHAHPDGVELKAENGRIFTAKLAIAADGGHSWLRTEAHMGVIKQNYAEEAIVAAVQTELPHQKIARQVFLEKGPLAFLPLTDPNLSSIVWTLPTKEAEQVVSLDDEKFADVLGHAFSLRLGQIVKVEKRYAFPLTKQQAKQYVKPRVALVGDAAHVIHPLAGQGANLGLLDAACLVEVIAEAVKNHRDFSALTVLRHYERWRKADNLAMLTGVHAIKHLFGSDKRSIQQLRALGLNTANQIQWLKKIFTRHAVGDREGLPQLAMQRH